MNVVFLGGPLHRKRRVLEDHHVNFVTYYTKPQTYDSSLMVLSDFQSSPWNNLTLTQKTTTYNILYGVKYFYGETIFVHEKFDIKKSKIIQKLEERECYTRSRYQRIGHQNRKT